MKQTAVQMFWDKIALKLSFEQLNEFVSEFKKAKQIEKEQIMIAFHSGDYNSYHEDDQEVSELYYKETYGQ